MESRVNVETRERIPHADQIVVTTNYFYRNYKRLEPGEARETSDTEGIRGDLAIQTLDRAICSGVRIVASDGGSSEDFLSSIEKFTTQGLTVVPSDSPDRGPQRRNAFSKAISLPNALAIVYTQPEKVALMDFLEGITRPICEGNADIVIPKREDKLFEETYPDYMRESELKVNKRYDWIVRSSGLVTKDQSFDWFFGPVVFKNDPEITALFFKKYEMEGSDPDQHSDGHYFPIIEALFNKKRVISVEVPFTYPEKQRANEMDPAVIENYKQRRKQDANDYSREALHLRAFIRGFKASKITEKAP